LNTNRWQCLLWWWISSLLNERGVRPTYFDTSNNATMNTKRIFVERRRIR
jgi:hypothetical protein